MLFGAEVSAQSVEYIDINKNKMFEQSDETTITLSGYILDTVIEGAGISSSFPASINRLEIPTPTETFEQYTLDSGSWEFESPLLSEGVFSGLYPDGFYNVEIGPEDFVSINVNGSYPSAPEFSATVGVWENGKLLISESEAQAGFQVTASGPGSNYLTLEVANDLGDIIDEATSADTLIADIQPGELTLGSEYTVELESEANSFTNFISGFSWSPDGTFIQGKKSSVNILTIKVVPDLDFEVQFTGNKTGQFTIQSDVGFTYSLRRSTDFLTDLEVSSMTGDGTPLVFPFDDSASSDSKAFFWVQRTED